MLRTQWVGGCEGGGGQRGRTWILLLQRLILISYQLKSSCSFHSDVAVTITILYSTELVFKKKIFFLLSLAVKSLSIHSFNYPFMQLTTHTNPSVYPNAVFEDGHLAFHQGLEDNVQVCSHRFSSVQSLSRVQIFVTP